MPASITSFGIPSPIAAPIAAARRTNGMSGLRHEIAHASFIADADVARFKALDAIAELSPKLWAPNAATPSQIKVLGAQRLEKIYRLKDLHAAKAEMTYASDWPASAPDANPWTGLAGMLTRRDVTGQFAGTVAVKRKGHSITFKKIAHQPRPQRLVESRHFAFHPARGSNDGRLSRRRCGMWRNGWADT